MSGILIGFANVIPGVSGGTIAVTLGIYRDIIDSFSLRALITSFRTTVPFFATLAGGAIVGVVVLARVMGTVLERFPLFGVSFFIGLMIGGLPAIVRSYRSYSSKTTDLLIVLFGCAMVVVPRIAGITGATTGATDNTVSLLLLAISGFVAAVAMVLPGISGSLVLLIFGSYSYVLASINNFDIAILIVFALSVMAGMLCCAKLMRGIFTRFPRQTWALILGLVIGSIIFLWPPLPDSIGRTLLAVGILLIALLPSYFLSSTTATE